MKKLVKPFLVISSFSIISFFVCFIVGLFIFKPNESINHTFALKCLQSIELFGKIYPSIVFATFLVSFSWEFASEKKITNTNYSEKRMTCLRAIYAVGLLSSMCLFLYKEVLIPTVNARMHKFESDYLITQKYVNQATKDFEEKNFDFAKFYIEQALMISPKNKELSQFRERILLAKADEDKWSLQSKENDFDFAPTALIGLDETDTSLLAKAKQAFAKKEYFDAHYFAIAAEKFASPNSPNGNDARALASDAWNKLTSDTDEHNQTFKAFQAIKRQAYIALMQADYCDAYYIFSELLNNEEYLEYNDADIKKYKDEAQANLQQQFFFIDEAIDMENFESFSNVYFAYENKLGGKDVFFIAGISLLQESGQTLQYCKDFAYFSFDEDGTLIQTITTPYCKMFPKDGEVFGLEHKTVPFIQLIAVDRNKDFRIEPTITGKNFDQTFMVLDLPYEDFNMIRQASKGAEKMPLFSMFKFAKNAQKYGFQNVEFSCTFANRLLYPLKTMVLFLILGILAWKFRLMPGRKVLKIWYLTIPIFIATMFVAIEEFEFFDSMNFFVTSFSIGISPISVLFCAYLALVTFFSIWFISTKS